MKLINQHNIFLSLLFLLPFVSLSADDKNEDLQKALIRRDAAAVEKLLAEGADPNKKDSKGNTAAHIAAYYHEEYVEILSKLSEAGCRFDVINKEGKTPLSLVLNDQPEIFLFILDWEQKNAPGFPGGMAGRKEYLSSLLPKLLRTSGNIKAINSLMEAGADWQILTSLPKDPSLYQPNERIVSADINRSYATLLMEWGMPVNIKDERGRTFLMIAADLIDQNLVLALLDPGGFVITPEEPARMGRSKRDAADPNIKDNKGKTALMYSYELDTIRILLRYGADPKIADNNGETAMHRWHSTVGAQQLLVEAGADVDAVNNKGMTPLMNEAARKSNDPEKHIDFLNELIELGADPHKKTPQGKNLLLVYMENHSLHRFTSDMAQPAVVQFLLDLGIDPAETDDAGNSALYLALKGDKKNPEVKEIQNLCLAAAEKREIAAARKQVRHEKRHEFALNVPEKLFYSSFLLIPLGYLGFSIAAREGIYRDNPEANWMGSVNAFLTCFIGGGILALLPFIPVIANADGWNALIPVFLAAVIVPVIGIITGSIATNKINSSFKENRGLYYIVPGLAGAISIPIFIYIWRM